MTGIPCVCGRIMSWLTTAGRSELDSLYESVQRKMQELFAVLNLAA